jgi:hypothetical protein
MDSLMANKEMQLKGDVLITRVNGPNGDRVEIRFTDGNSRTRFAEACMTLEQFAFAVTGMHVADVEMTVTNLALVGRKRLNRTETVDLSPVSKIGLADEQKLMACEPVMKRLKKET